MGDCCATDTVSVVQDDKALELQSTIVSVDDTCTENFKRINFMLCQMIFPNPEESGAQISLPCHLHPLFIIC